MPFLVIAAFEDTDQLLKQVADAFWRTRIHFPSTYFTAAVFISRRAAVWKVAYLSWHLTWWKELILAGKGYEMTKRDLVHK